MVKNPLKWLLYLGSIGLAVLGILFIIASYAETIRFAVGLVLIGVAILITYLTHEKKPIEIKQEVQITGPSRIKETRCPNCGAQLDVKKVQVIHGKPYVTCDYCENNFEITEEPTW